MQTFSDYAAAATTYVVALLTLCGAFVSDNASTIVQLLGFILLIARLVREVPAAVRVVRGWFGGR